MILYFSGAGNSRLGAQILAKKLEDELVSINDIIKNNLQKEFRSEKPFVVVAPIYAWRLPRIVERLLNEATFIGNKNIYFVATMGESFGVADNYCETISQNKNLHFKGFKGVVMPEVYIIMYDIDDRESINCMVKNAALEFEEIAEQIKVGAEFEGYKHTVMDRVCSGLVNSFFYKFMLNTKKIYVTEECISCGKCVSGCPLNNIELHEGKPVFENNCTHCTACIHNCPKRAIEVKGKTEKRGRYECPRIV